MTKNPRRLTDVEGFKRLWLDPSVSVPDLAKKFGVTGRTSYNWAVAIGIPTHRTQKRMNEELFRSLWLGGVPRKEIARRFGVCNTTVTNIRERMGLLSRKRWADRDKLRDMWSRGVLIGDIASNLGCSESRIRSLLGLPGQRTNTTMKGDLSPLQIDGISFVVDPKYEELKAESSRVMDEIQAIPVYLRRGPGYDALRDRYFGIGREMAKHMRVVGVKPLSDYEKDGE